jgi:flagellar biosynthesis/type III secretory pathway M-ring protein FliF/YscJ
MSGLDVLLAVAGFAVTALVVAAMILMTPHGEVDLYGDASDSQGSELSRADAQQRADGTARRPA